MRDFTKDTANYMSPGSNKMANLANGAAALSIVATVIADTLTASVNNNRILSVQIATNVTGFTLTTDASSHLRVGGRSHPGDAFQTKDSTTAIATDGSVTYVGGVLNFTGDSITPYLNGVAEGGGAVTFSSNTWAQGVNTGTLEGIGAGLTIGGGGPANTDLQFDGRIGEVAVWAGDIGADNMAAYAKGCSPLLIRPNILLDYFPLHGNDSPEPDLVGGFLATITGTIAKAAHTRIYYTRGPKYSANPDSAYTNSPYLIQLPTVLPPAHEIVGY